MHSPTWFLYLVIPSSRLVPSSLTPCHLSPAPNQQCCRYPHPMLHVEIKQASECLMKVHWCSLKWSVSHDSRITAWFLNDPEGVLLSQARVWNSCRADQGACFNEGSILSGSTHIMLFVELKNFRFYMICKERRAVLLLPIVALLYLQIFDPFLIYNRCFNFLKL